MNNDYVWMIVLVAVVLVIGSFCVSISYQHMRVRESILDRARKLKNLDIAKLDAALDEMLGPELRAFGSATDAEFAKKLDEILSE